VLSKVFGTNTHLGSKFGGGGGGGGGRMDLRETGGRGEKTKLSEHLGSLESDEKRGGGSNPLDLLQVKEGGVAEAASAWYRGSSMDAAGAAAASGTSRGFKVSHDGKLIIGTTPSLPKSIVGDNKNDAMQQQMHADMRSRRPKGKDEELAGDDDDSDSGEDGQEEEGVGGRGREEKVRGGGSSRSRSIFAPKQKVTAATTTNMTSRADQGWGMKKKKGGAGSTLGGGSGVGGGAKSNIKGGGSGMQSYAYVPLMAPPSTSGGRFQEVMASTSRAARSAQKQQQAQQGSSRKRGRRN